MIDEKEFSAHEAHENQVNENIAIACELFAKFAGYTREYLVFNTELYEP